MQMTIAASAIATPAIWTPVLFIPRRLSSAQRYPTRAAASRVDTQAIGVNLVSSRALRAWVKYG